MPFISDHESASTSCLNAASNYTTDGQVSRIKVSDARSQMVTRRNVAKMLIAVVVVFGVCFLPVHLLNILRYSCFSTVLPHNASHTTRYMLWQFCLSVSHTRHLEQPWRSFKISLASQLRYLGNCSILPRMQLLSMTRKSYVGYHLNFGRSWEIIDYKLTAVQLIILLKVENQRKKAINSSLNQHLVEQFTNLGKCAGLSNITN